MKKVDFFSVSLYYDDPPPKGRGLLNSDKHRFR